MYHNHATAGWFLKIFGLWHDGNESRSYKVYRIVFLVIFFLLYLGSIVISAVLTSSVEEFFSQILYAALTEMAMAVKTFYGYYHFVTIYRLHKQAISKDFQPVNAEEDKRSKNLLNKINLYFFGYLLWSTAGVWTNIAFLFNGQFKLPFFPWLLGIPYGKHLPYNYNFLLFYQLSGIWIHAVLNVIVDSQVGYLLAVAGIQMDFLAARLEATQAGRIGQKKFRNTYKQHIKHFNVVNNFVKNVERVYSKSVFSQFCASGITICAIAYRLSSVNFAKEFSTVLPIGIYLLSMLNQIFLHCYFGNEVTLKSSRLTNALYTSEWYKMAPKDRKNVVMMMTRSIRPITVKAGGFFHYNLHSFSWVRIVV
ncbi:odorant receptor 71a [Culex quinquefasciatus]|uniref:Odorant receptor n=1 Tax=Culex quinquefasciatus TaxID=7176 RepID=B0W2C0_CULQU|nr:odorant receptor 71a [Culex quinquefasciatus]|eukprot:XP_001842892.1 odorant receptor 71a [Culex quinquefasciatus]